MRQIGLGFIDPPIAMQAVEGLLTGPVKQLGVMATTRPVPLEGVSLSEWMSIPAERVASLTARLARPEIQRLNEVLALPIVGDAGLPALEELLAGLLFHQLKSLGLFKDGGRHLKTWKEEAGFKPFYDRWLEECLRGLGRRGYVEGDADGYRIVKTPEADWEEWERRQAGWQTDPAIMPYINLAEPAVRALPDVLTGAVRAVEVMFPDGSLDRVEKIYKNNPVADYFNEVLAGTAASFIEERLKQDPSARIRILEVGAGTGGTSASVLARLKAYETCIEDYRYTDLSQAFLLHAQQAYGPAYPFLSYGILDAEKPVAEQGIEAGSYDVVIAANVLHATRNIGRTMRNVKAALRTNGVLLINEITSTSLFTHLTFGLLEGWWLFEDEKSRLSGTPALSAQGWTRILQREGFSSILFPVPDAQTLGQQIIVAESNGLIRQIRLQKAEHPRPVKRVASREQADPAVFSTSSSNASDVEGELLKKIETSLLEKVSDLIKAKIETLDPDSELSEYGFELDQLHNINASAQ